MNPMVLNQKAPTKAQYVYTLGRITFLPHYLKKGMFVMPGHHKDKPMMVSETELLNRGAMKSTLFLWSRAYK